MGNPTLASGITQAPSSSERVRAHGSLPTSSAMLRHMRTLARAHRVDVGPACCGVHSLAWVREMHRREEVPW